jgi:hypothetical protein
MLVVTFSEFKLDANELTEATADADDAAIGEGVRLIASFFSIGSFLP